MPLCELFSGKYGGAGTTTDGSGDKDVLAYMNYFLKEVGLVSEGEVGIARGSDASAVDPAIDEASTLGMTLAESIQTKLACPAREKEVKERRAFFVRLIEANEDWAHQFQYWIRRA